jgi:glycerol-3-phosphate dehydrogenase
MTDIEDLDVLILGAGINGAGVFRDLCEQGLTCVIADKADFGSGTSAAPSRLIHGGIKYLETGEFRLVAQSTLERNLLLKNAPHCVSRLPTVIPIFSWFKGVPAALRTLFGSTTAPRSRGALLMKIGLMLYDFYGSRHRVMPRHSLWSKARALATIPVLTPRIVAAGLYYDARISHPERLVLELVQDGLRASPSSRACNYTRIGGVQAEAVVLVDEDGKAQSIRPRLVINAAGPWIDRVNEDLGVASHLIGGTKGSHILLDHPDLIAALGGRMIYFEADDGRICLVFDYLGKALVGSTDIRDDDPDQVTCSDAEIDYLLQSLRGLLPGLSFDRRQIVYTYAGIRPLPASDSTAPGLISRDHSAPVIEPEGQRSFPIVSLVGGKWTTFRGFAEEVTDMVLARLQKKRRISTQSLAIGGGRDFPRESERARWLDMACGRTGADAARADTLLTRYGTTALAILQAEGPHPHGLADAPDYSFEELAWIAVHEQVEHLEDLVLRRTALAITGRLTARDLEDIARALAASRGWTEERLQSELRATTTRLAARHGVQLGRDQWQRFGCC